MSPDEQAALDGLRARPPRLIAIGGSAGAFDALAHLLDPLTPRVPPLAVVVHVAANRASHLAQVLEARCALTGSEVCDKDPWVDGTLHVAPPGYHLLVERDGTFALSSEPPVAFARPSIDVLFESAAWALGPDVLAILLSGASTDGAAGAAAVRAGGGTVWVQRPSSATFPTMPQAGYAYADAVLSPDEIGAVLAAFSAGRAARGAT